MLEFAILFFVLFSFFICFPFVSFSCLALGFLNTVQNLKKIICNIFECISLCSSFSGCARYYIINM